MTMTESSLQRDFGSRSHCGGIMAVVTGTDNSAAIAVPSASPRLASLPADWQVRSDPSPAPQRWLVWCAAKTGLAARQGSTVHRQTCAVHRLSETYIYSVSTKRAPV